ncbi:MAG: hypothetical protein WAW69_10765 [Polaromonas sp.]
MDPIIGYAIFVLLSMLLAAWLERQINVVRKRIAADLASATEVSD